MINVGVIGCGYWGPNLVRNFIQLQQSEVLWVSDLDQDRLARMKQLYPSVKATTKYQDLLQDDRLDAVVVATPVRFHFDMARQALMVGKHVFVEKPLTRSVAEAKELIALAAEKKRKLMVGHTFLYTSAVCKMGAGDWYWVLVLGAGKDIRGWVLGAGDLGMEIFWVAGATLANKAS